MNKAPYCVHCTVQIIEVVGKRKNITFGKIIIYTNPTQIINDPSDDVTFQQM